MRFVRNKAPAVFSGHINFFTAASMKTLADTAGITLLALRKGRIGECADQVYRFCGGDDIFTRNPKIAFVYHACRISGIEKLLHYGITLHAIAKK